MSIVCAIPGFRALAQSLVDYIKLFWASGSEEDQSDTSEHRDELPCSTQPRAPSCQELTNTTYRRAQVLHQRSISASTKPSSGRATVTDLSPLAGQHEPPVTLELPTEIWAQILRDASTPHDPFFNPDPNNPDSLIPTSFLHSQHSHGHLLSAYKNSMRFKCSLALVSKTWFWAVQPILFGFIWITTTRDAERLAALILKRLTTSRAFKGASGRVTHDPPVQARRALENTLPPVDDPVGLYIRRIHLETSSHDRCPPSLLLVILENAPFLQVFSDNHSIRRNPKFYIVPPPSASSRTKTVPLPSSELDSWATSSFSTQTSSYLSNESYDSLARQIHDTDVLAVLLNPDSETLLHQLSWTIYDSRCEAGTTISYYHHIIEPRLISAGSQLRRLELNLCLKSIGGTGRSFLDAALNTSTHTPPIDYMPNNSEAPTLELSQLRTLKVTVDDASLHILAKWSMPQLRNLCIVSGDLPHIGMGLRSFLQSHGERVFQLELGHHESRSAGEEYWVTDPPTSHAGRGSGSSRAASGSPLAELCPYLSELICDASPSITYQPTGWAAPHALLQSHPTLRLIGIRNLDVTIREGLEMLEQRDRTARRSDTGDTSASGSATEDNVGDVWHELLGQMKRLLDRDAFPRLAVMRDMSGANMTTLLNLRKTIAESHGPHLNEGACFAPSPSLEPGWTYPSKTASTSSRNSEVNPSPPSKHEYSSFANLVSKSYQSLRSAKHPLRHVSRNSSSSRSDVVLTQRRHGPPTPPLKLRREIRTGELWYHIVDMCSEAGVSLEDQAGRTVTPAALHLGCEGPDG
ncbi:hypothetical protein D9611_011101 [Ephemerocybe angulata]|uniref:Uncharacterized protein n=1 Tax=Ephemerocybe angulata TaxID=980116 RepID=A0A8H5BBL5_9AGAR|nr:hypothetical protein D9611_011101 [Tulosesus angulatus]